MPELLISDDGITRTEVNISNGEAIVKTTQDVTNILDTNAFWRNNARQNSKEIRLAASIPTNEYYKWQKEWRETMADKWTWRTFLAMRLNSRDYSKFRTEDMRI